MATDHVFNALVQTFKELKCGDAVELSVRSPVTGGTGKNQIPHTVEIDPRVPLLEAVGEKWSTSAFVRSPSNWSSRW